MLAVLEAKKEEILKAWLDSFFASYPLESAGFLRTGTDTFSNPVGFTTQVNAKVLFDAALGEEVPPERVNEALEKLMHMRAIQEMPPSQAVGALYLLKEILRGKAMPDIRKNIGHLDEYLAVESRIDSLALLALDMYTASREKVFRLRVEELKRSQSQVLRWAQKDPAFSEPDGNTPELDPKTGT